MWGRRCGLGTRPGEGGGGGGRWRRLYDARLRWRGRGEESGEERGGRGGGEGGREDTILMGRGAS